ncbi:MAG: MBL fold metallo-hydrolase [Chloroflexia bacterium]
MDKVDGDGVVAQVRGLEVPWGQLAVWALGQHGYLLKGGRCVVIVDPYLSRYVEEITPGPKEGVARRVPIVARPEELDMVDLALVTHHHADHCDPRTLIPLMRAAQRARLVMSYSARDALVEAGAERGRIEVPPVDAAVDYGEGLRVTAIPAAHYEFEPDDQGNPSYLGFVVEMNGVVLYHAGDGVIYEGLVERLERHHIDMACLPINGRDWFREQEGLVGNMDYREAADLAHRVGVKVLIAAHNDMFSGNRINPAYLLDYLEARYPEQRVQFPRAGELYYYAG